MRVQLLVLVLLLAGCSSAPREGTDAVRTDGDPGLSARDAARLAEAYAVSWREGAYLVGLEAQEIGADARGLPAPPGLPATPDPAVGNGLAPYWLAGIRAPSQQFLLVAIDGNVTPVPRGNDHTLATAFQPLVDWKLDSPAAATHLSTTNPSSVYLLLRMQGTGNDTQPTWTLRADGGPITTVDARQGTANTIPANDQAQQGRAAFAIFVDGTRLQFNDARYDFQATQHYDAHLLVDETGDGIIHLKASGISMARFLGSLDISYQPFVLKLDEGHGATRLEDSNETYTRLYVNTGAGFKQVEHGPTHVLEPGQRLLLTYAPADMDADELRRQQAAVPTP